MIQKSIYSVFILVALLFSISACKTTKTAQGGEAARSVPKVKVPKDFAFSMIKTSCRGYCPGYNMSIDANGLVKYEGTRSVKNIGKHTKQLTKEDIMKMYEAVKMSE